MSEPESDYVAGEAPALNLAELSANPGVMATVAFLEQRITTLEEALLTAGRLLVWDCPACEVDEEDELPLVSKNMWPNVPHVPDCIVPEILSRHGGNG